MTDSPSPVRLDRMLCFAVYAAGHAFTRFYKPRLEALGVTYPQYLALTVLWEQDGLTVSELGNRLYLDSGTLTPLLKRLEARGLLARERGAADERQVMIRLTQSGRALQARSLDIPLAVLEGAKLSVDEADALRSQLLRLRDQLDASATPRTQKDSAR